MARYLWHSLPRHVRKDLAVNIVADCGSYLSAVYPNLSGRKLLVEVEDLLEDITRRAIKFAPAQAAIYTEPVMQKAVYSLMAEQTDPAKRDLYLHVWEHVAVDWYYKPRG